MSHATIDIAPVREWFSECSATESEVDRDLADSVAALEAQQKHLGRWQVELAAERAALDEERREITAERQRLAAAPPSREEQLAELSEAKKLITELRDMLLERTEELRRSDGKRAELVDELQHARTRQLELEKNLEAEKSQHLEQQLRWTEEFQRVSERLESGSGESAKPAVEEAGDPVLGSLLAQFGKLRRQAADRRSGRGGK